MTRRVVVMITCPGPLVGELDASHLWPFVPRVGDTIDWVDDDGTEWNQVVEEVVVHLDPSGSDADVWIGTAGVASIVDG